MSVVKDFKWKKGITVKQLVDNYSNIGFQSIEIAKASETIIKMKEENAKIFLTFTSNMVTSGLRGFFAQLIKLKIPDMIVTTVGGLEEDIMKSKGEKFQIGDFNTDDLALNEKGINRVGNLYIANESYCRLEDEMTKLLEDIYKRKKRLTPSELLREIGLTLKDENSILYQAAKNNIPIYCPAITDGALGFHLFLIQQKHPDFIIDPVMDFGNIILNISQDDKKGLICLGGSISKHHAILASLINGGLDYAVYLTTSTQYSGSMSGATTKEAKSWGKVKDDSDISTVIGDVTITFPLIMIKALEVLSEKGIIENE